MPDLPDHDCRGEGHAMLPGRSEGQAHQLVNCVLVNKINDYRLWHPVPGLPHHDGRGEAMERCPAASKAAPTSWLIVYSSVFRIHVILVWIRIRIRGSMPLTTGSGSGFGSWIRILLFSSLTLKMPTKNKLFLQIFSAYYFLKVHFHHFSKIRVTK